MTETRQVSGVPDRRCADDIAPVAETGIPRAAPATLDSPRPAPAAAAGAVVLGGGHLVQWGRACVAALGRARAEIDALNVFPVADSDTGTNLLATMCSAVAAAEAVAGTDPDASATGVRAHRVAAALAQGATAGARGNSGLILSQVLRGIAEATVDTEVTGAAFRNALARAAILVRSSLSEPVEGTVLTVLDRASAAAGRPEVVVHNSSIAARDLLDDAAAGGRGRVAAGRPDIAVPGGPNIATSGAPGGAVPDGSGAASPDAGDPELAIVVCAAADGAARALDETRDQLTVLREAGVVDAGARGLLVLLDTIVEVVTGYVAVRREYCPQVRLRTGGTRPPEPSYFEVMYRIAGSSSAAVAELRSRLDRLGDSVVVAGAGDDSWSVHVHCADAGAAIEAGMAAGTVRDIRIEYLAGARAPDQRASADHRCAGADNSAATVLPRSSVLPADRGVLAVAAGTGAAALFEDAGAVVLGAEPVLHGPALLAAVRRMPHREVLVLPNGALPAHELVAVGAAARDAHRDVLLLPSASMVQGLAAMAVHDRARIAVDDAFAMSEAAAGTRWGALRRAPGRALTMVGTCAPGDGLGLVSHDVVVIDRDIRAAGEILLDRMLGLGGELVTLLVGAAAPDGFAGELAEHVRAEFAGVEITVYSGGQQGDLIQIGVE